MEEAFERKYERKVGRAFEMKLRGKLRGTWNGNQKGTFKRNSEEIRKVLWIADLLGKLSNFEGNLVRYLSWWSQSRRPT